LAFDLGSLVFARKGPKSKRSEAEDQSSKKQTNSRATQPSVPAAVPQMKGDTGGKGVFKRRLARQRAAGK